MFSQSSKWKHCSLFWLSEKKNTHTHTQRVILTTLLWCFICAISTVIVSITNPGTWHTLAIATRKVISRACFCKKRHPVYFFPQYFDTASIIFYDKWKQTGQELVLNQVAFVGILIHALLCIRVSSSSDLCPLHLSWSLHDYTRTLFTPHSMVMSWR